MNEKATWSDTGNAKPNVAEYTVSEISASLKKTVEERFGHVRIRGEISGYRGPHSSGHCYFSLKDERARIEAVIWRGAFSRLAHKPEEGLEVIASGKLTTYPGSSKYQIVIDTLEPAGAGALMALLAERKKKLEAEGLFAPERKQLLPYMPRHIGVITSPTGAVIRDILHRINDRFPLRVSVWPVRVQGETTGEEVARAIHGFNQFSGDDQPDILIVARGGGSIEDLWGFNDEAVVRAAAASHIPLISAVGHETDWTLIDLAADVRAPTPTGAAELAVPVKAELEASVATYKARLQSALTRQFEQAHAKLLAATRGLATPDALLALPRRRLDEATARLSVGLDLATRTKRAAYERIAGRLSGRSLQTSLDRNSEKVKSLVMRILTAHRGHVTMAGNRFSGLERQIPRSIDGALDLSRRRLEQAARLLESYSYQGVLERGFAVVRDSKDMPVHSAKAIKQNDAFRVQFKDGSVDGVAVGSSASSSSPRKPAAKDKANTDTQGDLF